MNNITFQEAKNIIDKDGAMLIDVRDEAEYTLSHAYGAVLFPLDSISTSSAKKIISSKETPIILYCKTGMRSGQAYKKLEKIGYKKLYNLGSVVGWPYGMDYGL